MLSRDEQAFMDKMALETRQYANDQMNQLSSQGACPHKMILMSLGTAARVAGIFGEEESFLSSLKAAVSATEHAIALKKQGAH